MENFKYIHLLLGYDAKFSGPLVETFYKNHDIFRLEEHLFITPYESVKDSLSDYPNLVLDKTSNISGLFNKYSSSCEWIISHGLPDHLDVLRIKRKNLKKIIWRTWGGTRQRTKFNFKKTISSIKGLVGDLFYYIFMRYTFGMSPVLGISNIVDEIDLAQWGWHKKMKMLVFGYPTMGIDKVISDIEQKYTSHTPIVNVLVGHQGDPNEHHMQFVHQLLSFNNNNLKIYLPLSYGNQNYIKEIIPQLRALNNNNIVILDSLLPKFDYIRLLSEMDIAIFDGKSFMAGGNIAYLLYFRKKMFLNEDGIIRKAFDHEKIPYCLASEIRNMSYESFVEMHEYKRCSYHGLSFSLYATSIDNWKNLFIYLDGLLKDGKY